MHIITSRSMGAHTAVEVMAGWRLLIIAVLITHLFLCAQSLSSTIDVYRVTDSRAHILACYQVGSKVNAMHSL